MLLILQLTITVSMMNKKCPSLSNTKKLLNLSVVNWCIYLLSIGCLLWTFIFSNNVAHTSKYNDYETKRVIPYWSKHSLKTNYSFNSWTSRVLLNDERIIKTQMILSRRCARSAKTRSCRNLKPPIIPHGQFPSLRSCWSSSWRSTTHTHQYHIASFTIVEMR